MAPALDLPAPKANGQGSAIPRPAQVEDVDETTVASSSSSRPKFTTGGIIYPPPDIRSLIDRTAGFVARNGAAFETKIKGDERANSRFTFLQDDDPFNGYYRAKIEVLRDGTGPLADAEGSITDGAGAGQMMRVDGEQAMEEDRLQEEALRPEEPRATLFSADLPNITAIDLGILKLTALFVARKGRSFATTLLAREANSFQFEFLRPTHSLFGFFNRLVEQYRLVLEPPTDLMDQLKLEGGTTRQEAKLGMGAGGPRQAVLKEARKRQAWEKYMDERRKQRANEEEEEKAAFAEIDWQDFVVVATVEVTEADQHIDLPAPMSLREVENMTMAQKRMATMIMEEEGLPEEEAVQQVGLVDLPGESSNTASSSTPRPPAAPAGSAMKIRKDYVPKTLAERQSAQQMTTTCPVCGETIATADMAEHVRIELRDPKYREQRAELESRRAQQAALTAGADPSRYLKSLAGARTDIFGSQSQEEALARKEAEERQRARDRERIIWDGHAASRTSTTENFNRSDQVASQMKDIQGRFKPKDTESIGPQARPGGEQQESLKRPGEMLEQPPSQRPAYEAANGVPTGPRGAYGQPAYGHLQGQQQPGSASPMPPDAAAAAGPSITLTLQLSKKSLTYANLPSSSTIASIRDRIQSEEYPSTGASRIKLKWKRTGKMLNLKTTLGEVGMGEQEEIEVQVK